MKEQAENSSSSPAPDDKSLLKEKFLEAINAKDISLAIDLLHKSPHFLLTEYVKKHNTFIHLICEIGSCVLFECAYSLRPDEVTNTFLSLDDQNNTPLEKAIQSQNFDTIIAVTLKLLSVPQLVSHVYDCFLNNLEAFAKNINVEQINLFLNLCGPYFTIDLKLWKKALSQSQNPNIDRVLMALKIFNDSLIRAQLSRVITRIDISKPEEAYFKIRELESLFLQLNFTNDADRRVMIYHYELLAEIHFQLALRSSNEPDPSIDFMIRYYMDALDLIMKLRYPTPQDFMRRTNYSILIQTKIENFSVNKLDIYIEKANFALAENHFEDAKIYYSKAISLKNTIRNPALKREEQLAELLQKLNHHPHQEKSSIAFSTGLHDTKRSKHK